jgi:hypothetical protein
MLIDDLVKPVKEERSDLDERLLQADRNISEAWIGLTKRSMLIGWEGAFIKRYNGWERLGYMDEKHYRADKGIGRSTWYKMVGLAEHFPNVSKEQFLAMSIENAEQLAVVPLEARENPVLLSSAATKTAREFESDLIFDTAVRENKPVSEVFVTMKWRIRQAQREVIERGLEDWQHEHGIDDPGYALELMIAEVHERLTLVGFMTESIPRLSRAVMAAESQEDLEDLRKLFARHIQEMGEVLKICCGEFNAETEAA